MSEPVSLPPLDGFGDSNTFDSENNDSNDSQEVIDITAIDISPVKEKDTADEPVNTSDEQATPSVDELVSVEADNESFTDPVAEGDGYAVGDTFVDNTTQNNVGVSYEEDTEQEPPYEEIAEQYSESDVRTTFDNNGDPVYEYDDSYSTYNDDIDDTPTYNTTSVEKNFYDDPEEFDIDEIMSDAIDQNASDIQIGPFGEVRFAILGNFIPQPLYGNVNNDVMNELVEKMINEVANTELADNLELDTSYVITTGRHAGRRARVSVGKSFNTYFIVMRIVSDIIPTPDDLMIPDSILEWTRLNQGLVMVNGSTGTGKTTMLASLLNEIRKNYPKKIETVENPIEFVYPFDDGAPGFATQREVGPDTRSYQNAMTSMLRHVPDVILLGEVRTAPEVDVLLRACSSGHMSFTTMHTSSAVATVNTIKDMFQGTDEKRVLSTLSDSSRGYVNQVLVHTIDGKARFPVREVLHFNDKVSQFVKNGDTDALRQYQLDNRITLEDNLVTAVESGLCTENEARYRATYPWQFDEILEQRKSERPTIID